jgi:hypothetical protein
MKIENVKEDNESLFQLLADYARAAAEFTECCRQALDNDWQYSLQQIDELIAKDGTFLRPKVKDESDHWEMRGELLKAFRKLEALEHELRVEAPGLLPRTAFGEELGC